MKNTYGKYIWIELESLEIKMEQTVGWKINRWRFQEEIYIESESSICLQLDEEVG